MTSPTETVFHAQCPHCATISKINYPQLQQNKGMITCRRCDSHYPARGHLLSPEHVAQLAEKIRASKEAALAKAQPNEQVVHDNQSHTQPSVDKTAVSIEPLVNNDPSSVNVTNPANPEHILVGVIGVDAPVSSQKTGLFAKLLSRKNTKSNQNDEVVLESEDKTDGFIASKAKLHVNDSDDIQMTEKEVDYIHATSLMTQSETESSEPTSLTSDFVLDHQEVPPAFSRNSKIDSLLVRAADESPLSSLSETEVIAPDYEANKQWFTQMFSIANTSSNMQVSEQSTHDENESIQTVKRLHDTPNTNNTVTMRLPENSMLVFTLEDQSATSNTHSMLDLAKSESRSYAESQTIQVLHMEQNEHTMWTVANIVAILVLIIQMFYYFLLLTP